MILPTDIVHYILLCAIPPSTHAYCIDSCLLRNVRLVCRCWRVWTANQYKLFCETCASTQLRRILARLEYGWLERRPFPVQPSVVASGYTTKGPEIISHMFIIHRLFCAQSVPFTEFMTNGSNNSLGLFKTESLNGFFSVVRMGFLNNREKAIVVHSNLNSCLDNIQTGDITDTEITTFAHAVKHAWVEIMICKSHKINTIRVILQYSVKCDRHAMCECTQLHPAQNMEINCAFSKKHLLKACSTRNRLHAYARHLIVLWNSVSKDLYRSHTPDNR